MIDFTKLTEEQSEILTDGFWLLRYDIIDKINLCDITFESTPQAVKDIMQQNKETLINLFELVFEEKYEK